MIAGLRLAALGLALALAAPAAATETPNTYEVADTNSAGWMMDAITVFAEWTGASAVTSEDPEVVDDTVALVGLARHEPVYVVSHTRPHVDGVLLQVVDTGFTDFGADAARLHVDVVYDDGFVASFDTAVVTDGAQIATWRITGPGWGDITGGGWGGI